MNIKIVLCIIMMFFIPDASAVPAAFVWTAKSTGYLSSEQSLSYENFIIRAKALDSTRASISVYKGMSLIETREFNVNDFNRYENIGVTLIGIADGYSWISLSKMESKDVWRPISRMTLNWGEIYNIENYTINIDTFGTDSVDLIISNKTMTDTRHFSRDDFKEYDPLGITVREINRTGFIELEFFTNKIPEIKADISTDKKEYFPDETVQVTVNITSDVVLNAAGITLESNPYAEFEPRFLSRPGILGTYSYYSTITDLSPNSTLTINADIQIRDYYNRPYYIFVSQDVQITPEVAIIKNAPIDTDDEKVPVQLYVYNSASEMRSIHIHDTIPDELAAREMDWDIELDSRNSTTLEYNVTPEKPGLYFLPAATAGWNGQSADSGRVRMTMHMPYISMAKTALNNNTRTEVRLVISNIGDRPAQVKAEDNIPKEHSVNEGNTEWSGKLEGGESADLLYSLKGNIMDLPAAEATYRDIRGINRAARSNIINLRTNSSNGNQETSTIKATSYQMTSFLFISFVSIVGLISLATMITYLFIRFNRRK